MIGLSASLPHSCDVITGKVYLHIIDQNFDIGKNNKIFHHSLKQKRHLTISQTAKFNCEVL